MMTTDPRYSILARASMMVFAGNNALLWGGRIFVPYQLMWTVLYANFLLILQSCYSLVLYERVGVWIWISTAPQLCLTLVYYLRAAFTDPGVLARFLEANRAVPARSQRPLFLHCDKCQIWIQPHVRARHCDVCDNCIVVHDHHSSTLGTCVGQRNFLYYYLFLVLGNILVVSDAIILLFAVHIDRVFWTETKVVGQLLMLAMFAMPMLIIAWLVPLYGMCKKIARGRPGCGPGDISSCRWIINMIAVFYEDIPPSQILLDPSGQM